MAIDEKLKFMPLCVYVKIIYDSDSRCNKIVWLVL